MILYIISHHIADGKDLNYPDVFPKFLFCAVDPWSNLSRYENIEILYNTKTMRRLSPMRLTYFGANSAHFLSRVSLEKQYGILSNLTFRMCSKAHFPANSVKFIWNGVHGAFFVFFWFTDEDPFINGIMSNGRDIYLPVTAGVSMSKIAFYQIEITRFYTGRDSLFTKSFPEPLSHLKRSYDRNLCAYYILLRSSAECPCLENYVRFLESVFSGSNSSETLRQFRCHWFGLERISCHCREYMPFEEMDIDKIVKTYKETIGVCKANSLRIEYNVRADNMFTGANLTNQTWLLLDESTAQIVTYHQVHAMGVNDLLAQIGGFAGLLIGASIITVFEFVDVLSLMLIRRVFL